MLDSRAAFQSVLARTDELLAKTARRVAASPLANVDESKTAERVAIIDQVVAETNVAAQEALSKLAALDRQKIARRQEKVALIQHIARVADRLLAN